MYQSTRLFPDILKSIASSTVSGTYQPVGSSGAAYMVRILRVLNNSTQDVTISWDGIHDHDYIPTLKEVTYQAGTQRGNSSDSMNIAQGTQLYVKGTAGTGNVYVVAICALPPNANTTGV